MRITRSVNLIISKSCSDGERTVQMRDTERSVLSGKATAWKACLQTRTIRLYGCALFLCVSDSVVALYGGYSPLSLRRSSDSLLRTAKGSIAAIAPTLAEAHSEPYANCTFSCRPLISKRCVETSASAADTGDSKRTNA